MARFLLQRAVSVIAVLFAISVLTFLIFQAIPNGDPALRLAGRLATPQQVADVRAQWGFDKPLYDQYFTTMGKILSGSVVSYTQQVNVLQEIKRDLPATLSLAIGAGVIWLGLGIVFGVLSAISAGKFLDRALTVLSLIGVSTPVFFLGAMMLYYLGYKWGLFPLGGLHPADQEPVAVVHAPADAVVRAVGAVHRRLLARAALDGARHAQRGLRARRAGEGHQPLAACSSATSCATP